MADTDEQRRNRIALWRKHIAEYDGDPAGPTMAALLDSLVDDVRADAAACLAAVEVLAALYEEAGRARTPKPSWHHLATEIRNAARHGRAVVTLQPRNQPVVEEPIATDARDALATAVERILAQHHWWTGPSPHGAALTAELRDALPPTSPPPELPDAAHQPSTASAEHAGGADEAVRSAASSGGAPRPLCPATHAAIDRGAPCRWLAGHGAAKIPHTTMNGLWWHDETTQPEAGEPTPRCPSCGQVGGGHGMVHVRHGNGGGHNEPCPKAGEPT